MTSEHKQSNVGVKANIWCDLAHQDIEHPPYFLQDILPGDLLVELVGTRDVRVTRRRLTPEQHYEYEQSRFFQKHGQEGLAFGR
jgi:hypothetical protein